MHQLKLSLQPGNWQRFIARRADPAFRDFAQRVLNRDVYTCQFCGFQARDFQEVINLDNNYSHNNMHNMVTACVFCTQCHFLEAVGRGGYGGGTLIYLPELSQAELNGLSHVLFCAIANATAYRQDAHNIYRNLKLRSQYVDDTLGENMSNPTILGQLLVDAQLKNRAEISNKILNNVKLLPSRSKFSRQIETWAKAALEEAKRQQAKK